jgi:fatty-acyl-CoA synthase
VAFAAWLAAQPDMGTKWGPRFVRVSEALPQTATGKVTKVELREEAWICTDPVWWRPSPGDGYRLLSPHDCAIFAAGLSDHGRPPVGAPRHR